MAAQYLTTSRLSNIVSMITLGHQSGILRVIRGQGAAREIGQIKFAAGEPVSALLGQLTGPNALGVLMNWGECVYAFDEYSTEDLADGDVGPDGGRIPSDPGRYSPQVGVSSGSWPAYNYPSSSPYSQPAGSYPSTTSLPNFGPQSTYGPSSSMPPLSSGNSGDMPRYDAPYSSTPAAPIPLTNTPITPEVLATVFRRSIIAEHSEQLPLDRRERMILLLVDSRRNVVDLTRLTRRNEREVLSVLEHLASLGLIQVIR